MSRHKSILFTFGLLVLVAGALAWTFQFDLHFRSKILSNLTANWKTRGPTKLDNRIINTINQYGKWVIVYSFKTMLFLIYLSLPEISLFMKDLQERSSDLNPIENPRSFLKIKLYEGSKQYNSKLDLQEAIKTTISEIESTELEKN